MDGIGEHGAWFDNTKYMWFCKSVQEAASSHDYKHAENKKYETWTEIVPPRGWTGLNWKSTAHLLGI